MLAPPSTMGEIPKTTPNTPNPHALYQQYLADATSGDAESQYILYKALDMCAGVAGPEDIERLGYSNVDPEVMAQVVDRHERCKDLTAEVHDIREAQRKWYAQALEAGYPLARLRKAVLRTTPEKIAEELVLQALQDTYSEPMLYGDLYSLIGAFYANSNPHDNIFRREAWEVLHCSAMLQCNSSQYFEDLRNTGAGG